MAPYATPAYVAAKALAVPADLARADLLRSPLLPWKPWLAAAGLDWAEPEQGAVFNDLGMLLEVAAAGFGVALGTQRLAAAWVESGRLAPLFDLRVASPNAYHAVAAPAAAQREDVAGFIAWLVGT
jgi:DNA-binding transcriptional LysR family regulator